MYIWCMCVHYRGAFSTGIYYFRKRAQSQMRDLVLRLYSPGYLPDIYIVL